MKIMRNGCEHSFLGPADGHQIRSRRSIQCLELSCSTIMIRRAAQTARSTNRMFGVLCLKTVHVFTQGWQARTSQSSDCSGVSKCEIHRLLCVMAIRFVRLALLTLIRTLFGRVVISDCVEQRRSFASLLSACCRPTPDVNNSRCSLLRSGRYTDRSCRFQKS